MIFFYLMGAWNIGLLVWFWSGPPVVAAILTIGAVGVVLEEYNAKEPNEYAIANAVMLFWYGWLMLLLQAADWIASLGKDSETDRD